MKKKRPDKEETEMQDANKTKSPKRQTEAKISKLRQSPSQVKSTQKRGRKGKEGTQRMASDRSTPEETTPKKRGRPKKENTQRKAPSDDGCDVEPVKQLGKKTNHPEMKEAVVLLERMSKRDVIDMITQSHTPSQEETTTAAAESEAQSSDEEPLTQKVKNLKQQSKPVKARTTTDGSSDDEPLVRQGKAAPTKNKCRKRTNGEKDTPKQESELGEEVQSDSGNECLAKRK
ncbi:neurofilament heavy polypeptide-like [Hoplias malabaricus]|uniref:neurofilament heavy polypeptide-like n=1 Tax=Hoplias malabaricus TaxID=27720 RepID=UPI00346380A2